MRSDEFAGEDFSVKLDLEDLLTSNGQLTEVGEQQHGCERVEARKWTSLSQPVSRRPSVASIHSIAYNQQTLDDLLNSQFSMNGLSTLSQLDLGTLPPAPDLYTDFSFLLDRLEVPLSAGSGSSGVVPVNTSPATSNRGLSLSPLCFAHDRSRSNTPSPDTAGNSETSAKFDGQTDTLVKAGGKVQKVKIPRHKRPSHQRAEAKRRTRIQDGLDQLRSLVPNSGDASETSSSGSRSKNSKADLLRKSADYCRRLHMEYNSMLAEADMLRAEMQALTAETKCYQDVLPAEGFCRTHGPKIPIEQMFTDYVHTRGLSNWKFWIFGQLMRPVFESYSQSVTPANGTDIDKSVMGWARDYLSLIALRPALMSGLRSVVTSTSVVRHPERFEGEVRRAIMANAGLIPSVSVNTSEVSSAR